MYLLFFVVFGFSGFIIFVVIWWNGFEIRGIWFSGIGGILFFGVVCW